MNALISTIRVAICCALPLFAGTLGFGQEASTAVPAQRNQVIALDANGLVSGRIVAIDGLSKTFAPLSSVEVLFVQNGNVVRSSKTDTNGEFSIDGLSPGAYSFVGKSPKGFIAYGIAVKANEGAATAPVQIVAPAVSPRFIALKEIVDKYLPRKNSVLQQDPEIKTAMDSTADIADGANRVYIIDGNLSGTVRSIVAQDVNGTRVFLVQNDKIVGESQADQHGKFQFANVDAGAYDFVAAGPAGFAAIGVQAVVQEEAKNAAESVVQAVSDTNVVVEGGTQAAPAQEVDAALTPAADGQVVAQNVEEVKDAYGDAVVANEFAPGSEFETCAEDISCGGAMGGYGCGCESDYMGGGGCGGFGGLGDIGGLARAIVAGWVLTELIDNIDFNNDDDNPNPPGPISPR